MKKKYIVKHQYDFERIINKNNKVKSKYFIIYYEKNNLGYNCYGVSVGKKLGNAVYRNLYKRRMRNIIDESFDKMKTSYNYIVILKKEGKDKNYNELKIDYNNVMKGQIDEK